MKQTTKDLVKITFLSAATVITFAGASFVLPAVVSAKALAMNGFGFGQTVEMDASKLQKLGINIHRNNPTEEDQARVLEKLFGQYNSMGIRDHLKSVNNWKQNDDVLEFLEISRTELFELKQQGKTIFDIAAEKNKSEEELKNILEDHFRERLEEKLSDGRITQERYDAIIERSELLRERVNM